MSKDTNTSFKPCKTCKDKSKCKAKGRCLKAKGRRGLYNY